MISLDDQFRTLRDSPDAHARSDAMASILKRSSLTPVIHKWATAAGSADDAEQEAAIRILTVLPEWDDTRPAAPFFSVVLSRRLKSLYKAARCSKRHPIDGVVLSLNEPKNKSSANDHGKTLELADIVPDMRFGGALDRADDRDEYRVKWQKAVHKLTKIERQSFVGVAKGYTYEEISEITGRQPKSVDNALIRARRKLQVRGNAVPDTPTVSKYILQCQRQDGTTVYSLRISLPGRQYAKTFLTLAEAEEARDRWLSKCKGTSTCG